MRITIDAVPLLFRSAGVKSYLYHWIRHLRRLPGAGDIRLFPFLGEPASLDHQRAAAGAFGAFARLGLMFALNRVPFDFARWAGPRTDLFHASKLLYPPRNARITATVYDLTCWTMPDMHSPSNVSAEKAFAELVWKRAGGLVAISEATRQDLLRILRLPPDRVRVIYPGVADEYFQAGPSDAERTRVQLSLTRPYALFVGTIEPRKNVALLLDAWAALPGSVRDAFDLVLAGPEGWRQRDTMARLRQPPAGVRYLGYVPEQQMPGLFAGATALVYPSLYEGFGFPVAQAMAMGTSVITSGVSSLPEIAGGAAALIDPKSEADLRQALKDVLTSPAKRAAMSEQGRRNAQRFSWARCARESMEFFESVR